MKTCNYATVRFLPYRETGEFVNVGVALFCRETGFFDFRLETERGQRVADFFPELNHDLFNLGQQRFSQELDRVKRLIRADDRGLTTNDRSGIFQELVRQRESVFRFSELGTVLAEDPEKKLDELFERFVNRQFATVAQVQTTSL